jgi:RNA-directed DNA polymerase
VVTREESAGEPKPKAEKPFVISKWAVKEAYEKVKATRERLVSTGSRSQSSRKTCKATSTSSGTECPRSKAQAEAVLGALAKRLADLGLELHPEKTRIVYCKDEKRRGDYDHISFDFLAYTFRCRTGRSKYGVFDSFTPAVSDSAAKAIRQQIRHWRLHLRSAASLVELAREINPVVRGWINYYGRFYRSWLRRSLARINEYLVRWARRKYKRLGRHPSRSWKWLESVAWRSPNLFAHWQVAWP